jgi:transcriptional regulator with XRE-family HTH domain
MENDAAVSLTEDQEPLPDAALAEIDDEVARLGARIKERRVELGLSLRDLASITSLSATFLSSLERGLANPTLDSLRRVSNALGIPILRLADNGREQRPVVRHDRRRYITLPRSHVRYEILTPALTKKLALFQVEATEEHGELVAQPLAEPTEECILVLVGCIAVTVAGQTYELEAGDSVYFEGHELESIRVVGPEKAAYISAITPPVF